MLLKQIGLRDALESGRFGRVEMDWFLSLLRDTETMANEIDTMPPIASLRGFNTNTLLTPTQRTSVTSPTLMLWGENDPMGGAEIARRFMEKLPRATLDMTPNAVGWTTPTRRNARHRVSPPHAMTLRSSHSGRGVHSTWEKSPPHCGPGTPSANVQT